jgi:D-amino peptidase
MNALYLGALGVPVGMVAGDDQLAGEIEAWLPWAERVIVKTAVSTHAAASVHPKEAQRLVRDGAERATKRARTAGDLKPLTLEPPIEVGIDFHKPIQADWAAVLPGARREGDRGVRYTASDPLEAYRAFLGAMRLGSSIG